MVSEIISAKLTRHEGEHAMCVTAQQDGCTSRVRTDGSQSGESTSPSHGTSPHMGHTVGLAPTGHGLCTWPV